jgi:hypothetical protein
MACEIIPEPGDPVHLAEFFLEDRRFPAVYFLYLDGVIVYVGQTRTLKVRIGDHLAAGAKVFDQVAFIKCSAVRLGAIEGHYIRKLMPQYNACGLAKSLRARGHWHSLGPTSGLGQQQAADFLGVDLATFDGWRAQRLGPRPVVKRMRDRSRVHCGYDIETLRDFAKANPDLIAAAKAA